MKFKIRTWQPWTVCIYLNIW